jgi:hypothetical protein
VVSTLILCSGVRFLALRRPILTIIVHSFPQSPEWPVSETDCPEWDYPWFFSVSLGVLLSTPLSSPKSLFHGSFTACRFLNHVASNWSMIDDTFKRNWKKSVMAWSRHCYFITGVPEKKHKYFSQNNLCPNRDSNWTPTLYPADKSYGVTSVKPARYLASKLRCSLGVFCLYLFAFTIFLMRVTCPLISYSLIWSP